MRPGGVIIPIPTEDGPGVKSCGAAVWGKIIGQPKIKDEKTRKGTRKRLDLLIRTVNTRDEKGNAVRGKYLRAYVTSESVFFWILNSAEQGDTVLLFGEYQEKEYYKKNKYQKWATVEPELKIARDLLIQFAIPAQAIVDPVAYIQRFSTEADEHYSYKDQDAELTEDDDSVESGLDDWLGGQI